MAVYFVTGKLGQGKTLASVGRLREYLVAGRRVAGNLEIQPERLSGLTKGADVSYTRLPDKPRLDDLDALTNTANRLAPRLYVDALLGTGLTSALREPVRGLVD